MLLLRMLAASHVLEALSLKNPPMELEDKGWTFTCPLVTSLRRVLSSRLGAVFPHSCRLYAFDSRWPLLASSRLPREKVPSIWYKLEMRHVSAQWVDT